MQRLETELASDRAEAILTLTRRLGEATVTDYHDELGTSRSTVARLVANLCNAGLLERTHSFAKARNQSYRIPSSANA